MVKRVIEFFKKFQWVGCCQCGQAVFAFDPDDNDQFMCRDCTHRSRWW